MAAAHYGASMVHYIWYIDWYLDWLLYIMVHQLVHQLAAVHHGAVVQYGMDGAA